MTPQTLGILKDNTHTFVGLDLSVHSSGLSYISGDTVYAETFDATKGLDKDDPLYEGRVRLAVKGILTDFISSHNPDYVILEDVFNGATPKVYRQLMNINNIVDELILSNTIDTQLVRVNNRVWKSWLVSKVPSDSVKYMTDKIRVEVSLAYYGLTRFDVDHKGYQDEFDSIGMALGYYLKTFLNQTPESSSYTAVTGSNFNKSQLLSTIQVSQLPPANIAEPTLVTDKTHLNRAIRSGLLPFLRYSYDALATTGSQCLHYQDVSMGILCSPLKLQPTLTPTDIYISYKR